MEPVQPDQAEESLGDVIDDLVPTRGYHMAPVVGLGGGVGALPALRAFFGGLPADPGFACVVVTDEGDVQSLAGELRATTPLKVLAVDESARIQPDHVYVVSPGRTVRSLDGRLVLGRVAAGRPVSVDLFFRA